jgi:hypothetical protein
MSLSNHRIGEHVEEHVRDKLDLLPYDGNEFDAVTGTLTGTPCEIKAARRRYSNGRTGRLQIGRQQHERLQERGGLYVLVMYRVHEQHSVAILDSQIRSPASVDRLLAGRSWCSHDKRGEAAQLPVSEVFDVDE